MRINLSKVFGGDHSQSRTNAKPQTFFVRRK